MSVHRGAVLGAALVAGALGLAAERAAAAQAPGHYIVTVAPGHDPQGPARRAGARDDHVYHTALNEFAAALSTGQLERLRAEPDVASVEQDSIGSVAPTPAMDANGDP
jgi:hypothetical protein